MIAPLSFDRIMTETILFYDPEFHDECVSFCSARGIRHLPALEHDECYVILDEDPEACTNVPIPEEQRVQTSEDVFHPSFLERFQEHHVHFVYRDRRLAGVVHFSDYNDPVVSQYLYGAMADYERSLRELAVTSGLTEREMLDFFGRDVAGSGDDRSFMGRRYDQLARALARATPNAAPFQHSYLGDLIALLRHHRVIRLDHAVVELRNHVMHAHELVAREGERNSSHLFRFDSFRSFFGQVMALHTDHRRVRNRLAFLQKTRVSLALLPRR